MLALVSPIGTVVVKTLTPNANSDLIVIYFYYVNILRSFTLSMTLHRHETAHNKQGNQCHRTVNLQWTSYPILQLVNQGWLFEPWYTLQNIPRLVNLICYSKMRWHIWWTNNLTYILQLTSLTTVHNGLGRVPNETKNSLSLLTSCSSISSW